jgi:hypothetical protein
VFSLAGASWFVWRLYKDEPRGISIANPARLHAVNPISLWNEKQIRDVERLSFESNT